MILLKASLILALAAAAPASNASCVTTNIETALRHVFERYKEGGVLALRRESGAPVTPQFISESLKIRDVPNGYATLESSEFFETYEAALFKNPTGYHLVVVGSGASVDHVAVFKCDAEGLRADNMALPLSTEEAVQLYRDAGLISAKGKTGLTEKTVRDWAGSVLALQLPRKGRVIAITASVEEPESVYGKKLGTIEYVDSKFVIHSLAKKKAR